MSKRYALLIVATAVMLHSIAIAQPLRPDNRSLVIAEVNELAACLKAAVNAPTSSQGKSSEDVFLTCQSHSEKLRPLLPSDSYENVMTQLRTKVSADLATQAAQQS